ncbi:tripartite tricarboxylate transporter substrate binding protein [Advenella sp. RU8]|uniref:tripartite tricarboxylate transporter substrate binding protein n=1 Tax=Advenella sp. RU8 TaxID=3399575 RepID=UPI003AAB4A2D
MKFKLQVIKPVILPVMIAGLVFGAPAFAQDSYPSKPITIIVPYAPGGTTDLIARAMADSLSRQLKQTVVIENKSGAAGSMGANEMVTTRPDGYRLALSPVGIFRQPYLQQTRYDPIKDLTYIAAFAEYDFTISVAADSPIKSIKELVEHARKNPGDIDYGTPGRFTGNHVVMTELGTAVNAKFTHIPYKGDAENVGALMGGHIKTSVVSNSVIPFVQAGKVRILATVAEERPDAFADYPTLKELGYPVVIRSPLGLAGPKGLPENIVATLEKAVKVAMDDPAVTKVLKDYGIRTDYMDAAQYTEFARKTFDEERSIVERMKQES